MGDMNMDENRLKLLPARCWWAMGLRGLVSVIIGIIAFLWPGITVEVIVMVFGIYALIDGIFTLTAALTHREWPRWWVFLIEGAIGLLAGCVAFFLPQITALVLFIIVGAWTFITGLLEIAAALNLPADMPGRWILLIGGIVSVLFGIVFLIHPAVLLYLVSWLIGAYALLFGAVLIYLAYSLKCY